MMFPEMGYSLSAGWTPEQLAIEAEWRETAAHAFKDSMNALGRCRWCYRKLENGACPVTCRRPGTGHEFTTQAPLSERYAEKRCIHCGMPTRDRYPIELAPREKGDEPEIFRLGWCAQCATCHQAWIEAQRAVYRGPA